MKKTLLSLCCLMAILQAENFYDSKSVNVFENGFNAGLSAVKIQAQSDGLRPQTLNVSKNFLLILKIDDMGLDEALFLQVIAKREGFLTHLTRDFITFGEFEREIDARKASKLIIDNFKLNPGAVKILSGVRQIKTYPFLFMDFSERLKNNNYFKQFEMQSISDEKTIQKHNVVVTNNTKNEVEPEIKSEISQTQTSDESDESIAPPPPKITFKNKKAMSYKNIDNNESNSASFEEVGFKSGEFWFDKIVFTNSDEAFIKVADENLYFSSEDVE